MPAQAPPRLDPREFGLLILALLAREEMYGYAIVNELRSRTDAVVDLPEGTVYPALRRLERQGFIAGRWVASSDSPRRRYYRLTQSGERALADGRRVWRRFSKAADGLLGS
jgi:PadR family transcriptional regulator PadR